MHYEQVKVTIDASGLAKVILDMVVWYHGLLNSIVTDKGFFFTSKFWSSLCYFFGIKQRLSNVFYPQTDGRTKWQNSTIEVYLQVFVNVKQNDQARLLPMAKFAYNHATNASTSYTPFELNCGYYPQILYKGDVNHRSKSKSIDKLLAELRELIIVWWENLYHA